jgi:hypothetical protein
LALEQKQGLAMEYLVKQLGKIKKPSTFLVALIFILSLSWLADGFAGIIKLFFSGNLIFILISILTILVNLFLYFLLRKVKFLSRHRYKALILSILISFIVILFIAFFLKKDIENLMAFVQFSFSLSFFFMVWFYIKDFEILFSVKEVEPKGVKGLIMFLSDWSNKPPDFNPCNFSALQKFYDYSTNIRCPWEMQLRILEKYPSIEYVYVIGSIRSFKQISEFESLVKKFFEEVILIYPENGIDFENLEENIKAIEGGFKCLKEKNLKDSQILIETTGGQKIQSIAGAFFSSTYDRYFVYVSTNTKEVKVFDVVYVGGEG